MKDWKLNKQPVTAAERRLFAALIVVPIVGLVVVATLFL